eukprot:812779-Amorphochlora_amoeboformis.AAC.2
MEKVVCQAKQKQFNTTCSRGEIGSGSTKSSRVFWHAQAEGGLWLEGIHGLKAVTGEIPSGLLYFWDFRTKNTMDSIELGSKYRLFVSYIDKKEASFDVHFKGHKMLVPMTLKLSDIQKQGIDRLLGGSRANQKSNGTASGSRPGTLNGTRELSLPTLESSFEQDKK